MVGKLYVSGCSVLPPDETHEALEGYEWRFVSVKILFDDDNAYNYGMNVKTCTKNHYDIEGWDASIEWGDDQYIYNVADENTMLVIVVVGVVLILMSVFLMLLLLRILRPMLTTA